MDENEFLHRHNPPESTRKLSNFNFQWTKTKKQINLKNFAFFVLHFSRAEDVINHL